MRNSRVFGCVGLFLLVAGSSVVLEPSEGSAAAVWEQAGPRPALTGMIAFLYDDDVEAAERFYGEVLGLPKTSDRPDVGVFSVAGGGSVGIVDSRRGAPGDAVGISVIVEGLDDVDRWDDHLRRADVLGVEPPSDGTETPVRSVQFKDFNGMSMEVFAWLPTRGRLDVWAIDRRGHRRNTL